MIQSHKKTILGILFQRIIHLPLTACTLHTSILSVHIYICLYACHSSLSVNLSIYVSLYCAPLCSCPYSLWDRGLPLSPNSALHVWPRISAVRPPLVIVGLIRPKPTARANHWYISTPPSYQINNSIMVICLTYPLSSSISWHSLRRQNWRHYYMVAKQHYRFKLPSKKLGVSIHQIL